MNNNSVKSVSTSATKSKKSQRKGNKKSKNQIEFVAIPKQDLIWAKKQKPSVVTLWLECWECDPYGTRWMTLNHSLSESAFRKAKKLISSKGLFVFKPDRSIRDGRETVSWLVQNLHGSRRKNFGIDNDLDKSENHSNKSENHSNKSENDLSKPSISPQVQSQQAIPDPSITSQKHLTNSSKELSEVCGTEKEVGDRDRDTAKKGRVTSASPQSEKGGVLDKYPGLQQESETESSSSHKFSEVDSNRKSYITYY
ncbi:MAG: hypothetical protein AB4206_11270 [Xenococcaceae cyanobacterium]